MASNNSSNNFGVSSYVVSSIPNQASFTTIQAAVNAADAAGVYSVYIQPGTYNENLLIPSDMILVGTTGTSAADQVVIVGGHTTIQAGLCSITNITLQNAGNIFTIPGVGAFDIHLEGCTFDITGAGVIINAGTSNGNMTFFDCFDESSGTSGICSGSGDLGIYIDSSTVGIGGTGNIAGTKTATIRNSYTSASLTLSATASLDAYYTKFDGAFTSISTGVLRLSQCEFFSTVSVAGAGALVIMNYTKVAGVLTTADTVGVFMTYCDIEAQTVHNSTSQLRINTSVINAANPVITGTGPVALSTVTFPLGITIDNPVISVGQEVAASLLSYGNFATAGDSGSGQAGQFAFTNQLNTVQAAGVLTVRSTTGNSGANTGFLKCYVGATVAYIPYFIDIAP